MTYDVLRGSGKRTGHVTLLLLLLLLGFELHYGVQWWRWWGRERRQLLSDESLERRFVDEVSLAVVMMVMVDAERRVHLFRFSASSRNASPACSSCSSFYSPSYTSAVPLSFRLSGRTGQLMMFRSRGAASDRRGTNCRDPSPTAAAAAAASLLLHQFLHFASPILKPDLYLKKEKRKKAFENLIKIMHVRKQHSRETLHNNYEKTNRRKEQHRTNKRMSKSSH